MIFAFRELASFFGAIGPGARKCQDKISGVTFRIGDHIGIAMSVSASDASIYSGGM